MASLLYLLRVGFTYSQKVYPFSLSCWYLPSVLGSYPKIAVAYALLPFIPY